VNELTIEPMAYLPENKISQFTGNSETENTEIGTVQNTVPGSVVAMDGKARKELKMQTKRLKSLDDGISVYCVPVSTVLKWR
jgi:exosome complex RNA-binding protein Rrp4